MLYETAQLCAIERPIQLLCLALKPSLANQQVQIIRIRSE